jgi:hypothetical protein
MDDDKITSLKREINNFIHEHGPDAMTLKQAERAACILLEAFLEAQGPPVAACEEVMLTPEQLQKHLDEGPGCSHDYEARDTDGRLYCSQCKQYLEE